MGRPEREDAGKARDARRAVALFSQTVRHSGLIFTSGQGPVDMKAGRYTPAPFEAEARLTLENLRNVLEQEGSSLDKVLKITIYLADMDDYAAFNEIYAEYFNPPRPARSCIAASALAFGMKVELDAVARG